MRRRCFTLFAALITAAALFAVPVPIIVAVPGSALFGGVASASPAPERIPAGRPEPTEVAGRVALLVVDAEAGAPGRSGHARALAAVKQAVTGEVRGRPGTRTTRLEVPADQADAAVDAVGTVAGVRFDGFDTPGAVALLPNDTFWSIDTGRQRIDLPSAWDRTTGRADITIAVLDTGVVAVSDIAGRVLTGYDFVNMDSNANDDHGHGTMAATAAAAKGNNSSGVAGSCWDCAVLPVKVLDDAGSGWQSDIAEGIDFAVAQKAEIISMSLSGASYSQVLLDAASDARQAGVLLFAAAGNDGTTQMRYPAAFDSVVSIAGAESASSLYSWSNRGSWVTAAAPGCVPAQSSAGQWVNFCGTSAATPVAAGVAALALSEGSAPSAVEATISSGATPIANAGVGEIEADAWMSSAMAASNRVTITSPAPAARVGRLATVTWSASAPPGAQVQLALGGTVLATRPVTDLSANLSTVSVPEGSQQLRVRLLSGGVTLDEQVITVNHVLAPSKFVYSAAPPSAASAAGSFFYGGAPGDRTLFCDFDGNGVVAPVVVRASSNAMVWLSRNDLLGGSATQTVFYGLASDKPVCGDWDGDGSDGPGVFRGGQWLLRNSFSTGAAHVSFGFGIAGDTPLVGDWDGNGSDGVAVGRNAVFYQRNTLTTGVAHLTVHYGAPTDTYVVGDWDGNGTDTLGVFRGGLWLLRNSNTSGVADLSVWFGTAADLPYVGRFSAAAYDSVAVGR